MSHKCGPQCRRKQTPSTRRGCPTCGNKRTLNAGGRTRTIAQYMLSSPHTGMTRKVVAKVLDDWFVRGIYIDRTGRRSWNYLAYVPELKRVVRVAVSMDDSAIVNAFPDRNATMAWRRGKRAYFEGRFQNLEVRDWH